MTKTYHAVVFETQRFELDVEAENEMTARHIAATTETSEMVKDNEFYETEVASLTEVKIPKVPVDELCEKLDQACEGLTGKDLYSSKEIAAAFRLLAKRWEEEE